MRSASTAGLVGGRAVVARGVVLVTAACAREVLVEPGIGLDAVDAAAEAAAGVDTKEVPDGMADGAGELQPTRSNAKNPIDVRPVIACKR